MKKQDNDYTIFLLIAAGLGIYWLLRKSSIMPPPTTPPTTTTPPEQQTISTNQAAMDAYNVKYVINGMRKFGAVPNTI